ncbi:hypothetical protein GCM10010156_58340 [Planobispora rosea]|uniref:Uncharacterized protein n=1 Tax=Planobispora rosea TaxID=35762 RepID=A0A8J3WFU0_PLARO|nr:hypothetical protein GCM10010156_58340 [Planobispora rosea]GIH87137.1 hypothetical protein Pro02_55450 [Planobispora rosea]
MWAADRYQARPQCSGLQAGGEADSPAQRGRESWIAPGRSSLYPAQTGRFCCSMYWRRTLIAAPPTLPAK